jgi:putative membrane-bound dehydrogenase-like protein
MLTMKNGLLAAVALGCAWVYAGSAELPTPLDDRFTVELVAQEPEILTPTGIAVGDDGRVWCIENNTHFRPKNYKGYATDRIQIFSDFDADGHAKKITTFAEGFSNSMNLLLTPKGVVFATRSEIYLLRDTKNAGVADEKTLLAKLDTAGNYPHNGLSGLAIGPDGKLYFGLGENLGLPYKLAGADGTTLSGGGEGGNVYSCSLDGKNLQRVATGFWNPFGLGFDAFGRLFAVDNDPDARPPCRLMQVIRGGDHGYRFRFGRKGLHPYIAWNGEIPGTLPMISGTGEAPCAVLPVEFPGWPNEMRGDLLTTSWGDHLIQRFKLVRAPESATFTSTAETLIKGGGEFRPVGLVAAKDGSLLVSDWGGVSYPVHGKGRIWRIKLKQPASTAVNDGGLREKIAKLRVEAAEQKERRTELLEKALKDAAPELRAEAVRQLGDENGSDKLLVPLLQSDNSPLVKLQILQSLREKKSAEAVLPLLNTTDPFLFGACIDALSRLADSAALLQQVDAAEARVRLGVLLALRRTEDKSARTAVSKFLTDADPAVRRAAIQWVGEDKLTEFAAQLDTAAQKEMPRDVFEAFIAAKALLAGTGDKAQTAEDFVAMTLTDPKQPAALRALALKNMRVDHPALAVPKLKEMMGDAVLREEAIHALAMHASPDAQAELRTLAQDKNLEANLRADVIAGLSRSAATSDETRTLLLGLLADAPGVQREALRSLRGALTKPEDEQAVRAFAASAKKIEDATIAKELAEQALFALKTSNAKAESLTDLAAQSGTRPTNEAEWTEWLKTPGDAAAGRRIFYHPRGAQCFICHRVDGRGGNVGPELSTIARAMVREKMVQSVLEPSKEIAPQFIAWTITQKNGSTVTGVMQDEDIHGAVTLADSQGKVTKIKLDQIEKRVPQKTSLMPDNLVETLTKQEVRDLIAFLGTLKQ